MNCECVMGLWACNSIIWELQLLHVWAKTLHSLLQWVPILILQVQSHLLFGLGLSPLPGPESQSCRLEQEQRPPPSLASYTLNPSSYPTSFSPKQNPLSGPVLTSERPARAHNPNSFWTGRKVLVSSSFASGNIGACKIFMPEWACRAAVSVFVCGGKTAISGFANVLGVGVL